MVWTGNRKRFASFTLPSSLPEAVFQEIEALIDEIRTARMGSANRGTHRTRRPETLTSAQVPRGSTPWTPSAEDRAPAYRNGSYSP